MQISKIPLNIKYRPKKFKDVLGQQDIITVLKNIISQKNFSSPFMFTGIYGGGKTTLARIFSKAILCENIDSDIEPCGICSNCKSFENETNLCYTEIDAASNSGVDKIRKLKEDASFKSLGQSKYKVVVIDESHSISTQGNEALLKQLEDNSNNQVYIFCTTSPDKMLDTVRSRCFEFNISKSNEEDVFKKLEEICIQENIKFEKEALQIIVEKTFPHIRDSLKVLDYLSNFGRISFDVVKNHFKLNLRVSYLKLLIFIKNDLNLALELLKEILIDVNHTDIYQGLIESILDSIKFSLGINTFKSKEQEKLASDILSFYGDYLKVLLNQFMSRNKYSDSYFLESDIILLNSKINNHSFSLLEKSFNKDEYSSNKNNEEKIMVKSEPIEKEKDYISDNSNNKEDLEETTKIFKRYKAYPEQLAILFDKGKKSSSIKNTSTVELKRVKDFKRNLDKNEISDFLNNKRNTT